MSTVVDATPLAVIDAGGRARLFELLGVGFERTGDGDLVVYINVNGGQVVVGSFPPGSWLGVGWVHAASSTSSPRAVAVQVVEWGGLEYLTPDPEAVVRGAAQDRAWFQGHPAEREYLRPALPGEWPRPYIGDPPIRGSALLTKAQLDEHGEPLTVPAYWRTPTGELVPWHPVALEGDEL